MQFKHRVFRPILGPTKLTKKLKHTNTPDQRERYVAAAGLSAGSVKTASGPRRALTFQSQGPRSRSCLGEPGEESGWKSQASGSFRRSELAARGRGHEQQGQKRRCRESWMEQVDDPGAPQTHRGLPPPPTAPQGRTNAQARRGRGRPGTPGRLPACTATPAGSWPTALGTTERGGGRRLCTREQPLFPHNHTEVSRWAPRAARPLLRTQADSQAEIEATRNKGGVGI